MQQNVPGKIFKTSDGCSISYYLQPAAKPGSNRFVFIHSLALDAGVWSGVASRLSNDGDVLTYDCRGHGRSGREDTDFTTDLFARDLVELLDHVGWERVIIAGCSMGGCVAQAVAGRHPARVSALGLIDTTAWYGEDAAKTWNERAQAAATKGLGSMIDFQLTRWFGDKFRSEHPEVLHSVAETFLANDVACYAASCALLGSADLRSLLPALRVPTAIVVGEEDYATPVSESRKLHEAIRNSTLTILTGGRHLTPIECPDQIAAELRALAKR
jgi:3-oxoadipate enol-lactonase